MLQAWSGSTSCSVVWGSSFRLLLGRRSCPSTLISAKLDVDRQGSLWKCDKDYRDQPTCSTYHQTKLRFTQWAKPSNASSKGGFTSRLVWWMYTNVHLIWNCEKYHKRKPIMPPKRRTSIWALCLIKITN
jgi:hypothetical protein